MRRQAIIFAAAAAPSGRRTFSKGIQIKVVPEDGCPLLVLPWDMRMASPIKVDVFGSRLSFS